MWVSLLPLLQNLPRQSRSRGMTKTMMLRSCKPMAHHVKLRGRISAWVATEVAMGAAMVVARNVPNWASIHAAMDLAVTDHRAVDHVVDRTVMVCVHSAMMGHRRQSMACGTKRKAIGRANPRTESFFWKCTKTSRMRVAL
jgi:hypothetical protein